MRKTYSCGCVANYISSVEIANVCIDLLDDVTDVLVGVHGSLL